MRESAAIIQARLADRLGTGDLKASPSMKAWRVSAPAAVCCIRLTVKGAGITATIRGDLPIDLQVEAAIKTLGGTLRVSNDARYQKIALPLQHPYSALLDLAAVFESWPLRRQASARDRKYFFEAPAIAQSLRTAFRALAA